MESSSKKRLIIDIVVCVGIILTLIGIDIATKLAVYYHFNGVEGSSITVIDNFFWIYLTYNPGALASFLADVQGGRIILSILSILGSGCSIYYLIKHFNKMNMWLRIAIYLFIPGCTGNLIDRVGIYGTPGVIDFLSFRLFGVWNFPVFNFADMCLTVSIFILLIYFIFFDKEKSDNKLEEELETSDSEEIQTTEDVNKIEDNKDDDLHS